MMIVLSLGAIFVGWWVCTALLPTCRSKYLGVNTPLSGEQPELILSFDDGPDECYTPQLLDLLDRYQVKAIFFVLGEKALQCPALLERMKKSGHHVGVHGFSHHQTLFYPYRQCRRDLESALSIVRSCGCVGRYYRPPHGCVNLGLLHLLKTCGLRLLLWTVMVQDWQADATSEIILSRLRSRCHPGSLICLHDCGVGTGGAPGAPGRMIAALETFIPEMMNKGYRFVLPNEE
ncbi:MAG: polysaccharide deacetylase family protein [Clostridiales bacterium]